MYKYLKTPSEPPAIREGMSIAAEREEKNLYVGDFASANVGKMPANMDFMKFNIESKNKDLPKELRGLLDPLKRGIISSFETPNGLAYSPTGGTEKQKKVVSSYFEKFHGLPKRNLDKYLITAGGQQAMAAALRSLKPGTDVFLSKWEYPPIFTILKENGCNPIRIACDNLTPKVEELKDKVTENSVFYISMPNNPTGFLSPDILGEIVETIVDNKGGVIWDAPYLFTMLKLRESKAEFSDKFLKSQIEDFKKTVRKYSDNMCILSSISKTCLSAGIRYGFGSANEKWIQNMNNIVGRENLSSPTASFIIGHEILSEFMENPQTYKWLNRILAKRLTSLMKKELPLKLPQNKKFGGLYVLLKTGKMSGKKFAKRAAEESGIIVIPGGAFYGEDVNVVRLSLVSTPWSKGDKTWKEAIENLENAFHKIVGEMHR